MAARVFRQLAVVRLRMDAARSGERTSQQHEHNDGGVPEGRKQGAACGRSWAIRLDW